MSSTDCLRRYGTKATRQVSSTLAERRRTLALELAIGIGIPLMLIPSHLIVQGHQLGELANKDHTKLFLTSVTITDYIASFSCVAPIYPSIPAVFLSYLWQPLLNTVNMVYACKCFEKGKV